MLDAKKARFCMSISCNELQGMECKAKQCKNPDISKALDKRREQLLEVKNGRNA